jgi:hypothetical protein
MDAMEAMDAMASMDAMDPVSATFAARVSSALASPVGGPLATRFVAPLVTALVVEASEPERLLPALAETSRALAAVGVPRGRQFVLLGGPESGSGGSPAPALARDLARALGIHVHIHTPTGPCFTVGRLDDGTPIELDDELREAEAIVVVGRCASAAGAMRGGPWLIVPGVASAVTRRALAAARTGGGERAALAFSLAAEMLAPVDLAVLWDDAGVVVAGAARALFAPPAPARDRA